jgi:hypothetical protein
MMTRYEEERVEGRLVAVLSTGLALGFASGALTAVAAMLIVGWL